MPTYPSAKRHRDRYLRAGLVQINVWIPERNRVGILRMCAELRNAELRGLREEDLDDSNIEGRQQE